MDDVLGEIMLAGGDENLRAGDLVAAVGLRHCAGAHQAEIGAALRLGQVHRAGPLAVDQFRQIGRLLLGRAVGGERGGRPQRQARIHGERHVGRAGELVDRLRQRGRQVLAAEFGWRRGSHPTGLVEPFVGVLESRRRGDTAVVVAVAAFLVADAVERREYVLAEFCRLGEHRLEEIRRGVGKAGQVVVAIDVKHVAQEEHHVVNGGLVGRHDVLLGAVSRLPVGRTGQRYRVTDLRQCHVKWRGMRRRPSCAGRKHRCNPGRAFLMRRFARLANDARRSRARLLARKPRQPASACSSSFL